MNNPTEWDKAEKWVIESLWKAGYRQISGEALGVLPGVVCDWLDGRIGKTTFLRKLKRCLRRLDKRIAHGGPLLDLVQA